MCNFHISCFRILEQDSFSLSKLGKHIAVEMPLPLIQYLKANDKIEVF